MSVWMAETLIATTLLMALVMMLRRPVARWLGAGAAYALWLLPLARMLLPVIPREVADPSPLQAAVDQVGLPMLFAPASASLPAAVESAPSIPWLEIGVGIWLLGTLAFLVLQTVGYARFRAQILLGSTLVGEEGRLRIVTSPAAAGPLAFGVLRPTIVLPVDFALRYDSQEQEMAIAHERAHHERGDLAANMVALGLLALHWCNPIAWIAYRAYRADQELACDARVLALYGQDQAHAYGRAILKAAGGRPVAGACHLTRLATLKGRLKMLSTHESSLQRISWGMAAVGLVTATGLALTASGSRAAQQMAAITEKVGDVDFARLSDFVAQPAQASLADVPQAPEAPAAPAAPAASKFAKGDIAIPPVPSVPAAPPVPPVPAVDMVPPVPPMPPIPPVSVHSENGRITVRHRDGRVETHRIPDAAEIARRVPQVDVREGCEGDEPVSRRESVNADGRRVIRVRICQAAIESQARAAGRQAERAGRIAEAQARSAERMAERIAANAERNARHSERSAHMAALNGLRTSRAMIARNTSMPEKARSEALHDIDEEIADMRRELDGLDD
ncbi:M56 family metallopeptidase [Sphingobium ummariense]|uniref:Peptidase M56 domain-containing protein n=1 Tax=Sphingobium ummariense RL-3 TaxID=1346791 RepID=T0KBF8_9SPHN|nr:M56 family metallopeptidase [Sphingobium ummariense]EQB34034.1 hypothetical protein M529_01530 [Sphingobium ummariense RL-3]